MARNYSEKTRALLNGATTEDGIIRLLKQISEEEPLAIAKAEKAIFGRKTKIDEIAQLHAAALDAARGAIAPYEELKKRWEAVQEPEYELGNEFSTAALNRNSTMYKMYMQSIAGAVGDWFYGAKFANDPYAAVWGEAMAPITYYKIEELLNLPVERNYSIYPEHETWARSLPYGAYLVTLWFDLMRLNKNGLFDSYFVERAGVKRASDELYELVEKLK